MIARFRAAVDRPAGRGGHLDAEVVELERIGIFHLAGGPIGVASLTADHRPDIRVRRKPAKSRVYSSEAHRGACWRSARSRGTSAASGPSTAYRWRFGAARSSA